MSFLLFAFGRVLYWENKIDINLWGLEKNDKYLIKYIANCDIAMANRIVSFLHFGVVISIFLFWMKEKGSQSLRDLTKVIKPNNKAKEKDILSSFANTFEEDWL